MQLEWETARWAFELLLMALAVVLWFLMRKLVEDVKELGSDLSTYKLHVSEQYTRKTEFDSAIARITDEIRAGFNRVFDRLDAKADK